MGSSVALSLLDDVIGLMMRPPSLDRHFVLFAIDIKTREVHVAGVGVLVPIPAAASVKLLVLRGGQAATNAGQ